jgi:hypothetical protein
MLLMIIAHLFARSPKVPEEYMKMIRAEYRSVPEDYVEHFLQKNKRLPTLEELQHAI